MSTVPEDPENGVKDPQNKVIAERTDVLRSGLLERSKSAAFVGRLGGNQEFVDTTQNVSNGEPDAVPGMTLRQQLALQSFLHIPLWKAAAIEGMGKGNRVIVLP